jgi:site-specific recombinase XerD
MPGTVMSLRSLLRDYYAPLKGICDRTIELYQFTIDAYGELLGREPTIDDFDELSVARFLAHRVRTRSAATAAKDRSQIRALWEWASRRKLVDTWPTIPLIRVPERVPEAWMTDEMERLLASAARETTVYDGIPAALWWTALLLLAYDTGERATALISLRWQSVRGCNVLFRAEDRKGRRRDILREISVHTADALLAIKGDRQPGDEVFPWPRHRSYLWKRLEIILERAGLPAGRKDKFHKIRRTTASYYQAGGGSAQWLLDHADPATTRKYLDPRIVKGKAAPDIIPPIGLPPSAAG